MAPQIKRLMRRSGQYPKSTVMGHKLSRDAPSIGSEHPAVTYAVDRWISKRDCHGCQFCDQYGRVSRLRRMYGRKR